jgi:hypothetical protein
LHKCGEQNFISMANSGGEHENPNVCTICG